MPQPLRRRDSEGHGCTDRTEDEVAQSHPAAADDQVALRSEAIGKYSWVSATTLAKKAGLAPVRFARLIKRIFRLTPSQLIAQRRLAAASRLLLESGRTVAEIALACGFYDHSAFTRAFHAATGSTPTQFRAEHRTRPIR